ncbi:MAG: TetR family transcriptional regulator, partial [Pseudomonadota bacterium]|nr:TetR family transcriptional regulator [Pseudomonadota bacterium]
KRARTPEQKSDRRETILGTAKVLFMEAGYEGFSMGLLSKRAGVAKGTLYLYFGTKEEVLLSLYSQEFERFCNTIVVGISPGISDADFVSYLYETSLSDPIFLALHARLGTVIEQNISVDALITSKRNMATHFHTMVTQLSQPLGLSCEQTLEALSGISALLTGSYDGSSDSVIENEVIPEDVATFMGYFDMKVRFEKNAGYILQGIRASSR